MKPVGVDLNKNPVSTSAPTKRAITMQRARKSSGNRRRYQARKRRSERLKNPRTPVVAPGGCRSSNDDNHGASLSAQNSEIVIDAAIVSANCLYTCPVVPGKNATGIKTASNTSDDATTALRTSRIAAAAPSMP